MRSREREAARPCGGAHRGILGETARQLRREGQGARRVVSGQAKVHVSHSHAASLAAEIDRERSNQASAEKPGGCEQRETERDLRRDQSLVQTRAARDRARAGGQDRSGRRVRRTPGRQQAERDAHERGENGGESEGPGTELRTEETQCEVLDQRHLDEERQERVRHDQSRRAAGEAEQQAFRQDLPCDASPARAERLADGDLLLTPRASGQQKVREIRARDQQGREDGAREQSEDARRAELLVRAGRGHGRRDDGPSRGVEVLAVRGGVRGAGSSGARPGLFPAARRAHGVRRPTSSPSCGSGCRSSRADRWRAAARCRPAPRDPGRWRTPRRENPSARRPRPSAGCRSRGSSGPGWPDRLRTRRPRIPRRARPRPRRLRPPRAGRTGPAPVGLRGRRSSSRRRRPLRPCARRRPARATWCGRSRRPCARSPPPRRGWSGRSGRKRSRPRDPPAPTDRRCPAGA